MEGEKRLKEIQQRLGNVLREVSPESAEEYEIQYKPMEKYPGSEIFVTARDSPAYGLDLVLKNDPTKFYEIMHVFWPDICRKTPPNMEKYLGGSFFAEKIKKGIEELQKDTGARGKPSKLETLEVISILSILISIFFIQSNFTGFAIANLTPKTSNIVGITLFAVGLLGAFYYYKKENKI